MNNTGHIAIGIVTHLADMTQSILHLSDLAAFIQPQIGCISKSIGNNNFINANIAVGNRLCAIIKIFLDQTTARIVVEVLNRAVSKRDAADTMLRCTGFSNIAVLCRAVQ